MTLSVHYKNSGKVFSLVYIQFYFNTKQSKTSWYFCNIKVKMKNRSTLYFLKPNRPMHQHCHMGV